MKVFCIGFHKTGTSSLNVVLEQMGFRSIHAWWGWQSGDHPMLQRYDAFSDGCLHNFQALDRRFPGSKFVLNVRELEPWLYSKLKHIDHLRKTHPQLLSRDKNAVDTCSYSVPIIKQWIAERQRYHAKVLEYFRDRPQDLLILDYVGQPNEAVRQLAEFLGRPAVAPAQVNVLPQTGRALHHRLLERVFDELRMNDNDRESLL